VDVIVDWVIKMEALQAHIQLLSYDLQHCHSEIRHVAVISAVYAALVLRSMS